MKCVGCLQLESEWHTSQAHRHLPHAPRTRGFPTPSAASLPLSSPLTPSHTLCRTYCDNIDQLLLGSLQTIYLFNTQSPPQLPPPPP